MLREIVRKRNKSMMLIQSFKITETVINEHNPLKLRYIRLLSLHRACWSVGFDSRLKTDH